MNEMRSYHEHDFYELLEVSHDANGEEIEAVYQRLKSVFDASSSATYMLFGEEEADSMREKLDDAYLTLSDNEARTAYDEKLGVKRAPRPAPVMTVVDGDVDEIGDAPTQPSEPRALETRAPLTFPIAAVEAQNSDAPRDMQHILSSPAPREDENMEYSGGVLMRVRESKAVPLEAIAQRTKITLTHLRAIEANQYDKLPARVYVRGFVAQYAKFLGLNAERVCASYLAIYDRFVQAKSAP